MLGLPYVDAGRGWLIFRWPLSEVAVRRAGGEEGRGAPGLAPAELFLMTDDARGAVAALADRAIVCEEPEDAGWDLLTAITLPSGRRIGLHEPKHPTAPDP